MYRYFQQTISLQLDADWSSTSEWMSVGEVAMEHRKLQAGEVPAHLKTQRDRIDDFDRFMLHNHKPGAGDQVEKYKEWEEAWEVPTDQLMRLCEVKESGCWVWTGPVGEDGTPVAHLGGSTRHARRILWIRHGKPTYRRFWVVQDEAKCSNPLCISPEHSKLEEKCNIIV
jgi:hypothetical protein